MRIHRLPVRLLFLVLALLTGCGVGPLATPTATPGVALHGVVHGGQQPIAGAHVYLFAANTTGYGGPGLAASTANASISLLNSSTGLSDSTGKYVLSGSDGGFNITGDYTCTSGQQLYLYASGGNPGAGSNAEIGLMAVLGACPSVPYTTATAPNVFINEVTTVAAAYAFAGFASDSTHVSTNGTTLAKSGIANAFANAANLADLATGTALTTTPAGNGTVPTQTVNTLANILAACVNTADQIGSKGVSPSSNCSTLESANSSNGSTGTAAQDTATAAIYMAHNPTHNVATLFALPATTPPFGNALPAQPNDFTLSVTFTGGGLGATSEAESVAIDGFGNAWLADFAGVVEAFSPLGVPLSPTAGFTDASLYGPGGLSIDTSNNIWVASEYAAPGTLTQFSNAGAYLRKATVSAYVTSLAIDMSGNLWVGNTDFSNTEDVLELSSTGSLLHTYTPGGLKTPINIAVDPSNDIWVANSNGNDVMELYNTTGAPTASSPFSAGGISAEAPRSLALDSSSNVWVLSGQATLSAIASTGTALTGSPFPGITGTYGTSLVIDGQNHVFAATQTYHAATTSYTFNLLPFDDAGNALAGTAGLTAPPTGAYSLAFDGSGNLWVAANSKLVEIIGVGAPVETPVVQAVKDACIAQRPCLPRG